MQSSNATRANARKTTLVSLGKATRETRGLVQGQTPDIENEPNFKSMSLTRD